MKKIFILLFLFSFPVLSTQARTKLGKRVFPLTTSNVLVGMTSTIIDTSIRNSKTENITLVLTGNTATPPPAGQVLRHDTTGSPGTFTLDSLMATVSTKKGTYTFDSTTGSPTITGTLKVLGNDSTNFILLYKWNIRIMNIDRTLNGMTEQVNVRLSGVSATQ